MLRRRVPRRLLIAVVGLIPAFVFGTVRTDFYASLSFECRLEHLNISWCEFSSDHVKAVVGNLASSVTELNLSGYRENLAQEGDLDRWSSAIILSPSLCLRG